MMDENRSLSEELKHVKTKWANLRDDYMSLWSSFTHSNLPATVPVVCILSVDAESVRPSSPSQQDFLESCSHSTATALLGSHAMGTHSLQIKKPSQPHVTYASVASLKPIKILFLPASQPSLSLTLTVVCSDSCSMKPGFRLQFMI